jgi:hypothetical protein
MNIPKGRHLSIIGHLLAHFVRSPESGVACSSVPFFFHHPLVLELDLGNFFHHFLMHTLFIQDLFISGNLSYCLHTYDTPLHFTLMLHEYTQPTLSDNDHSFL